MMHNLKVFIVIFVDINTNNLLIKMIYSLQNIELLSLWKRLWSWVHTGSICDKLVCLQQNNSQCMSQQENSDDCTARANGETLPAFSMPSIVLLSAWMTQINVKYFTRVFSLASPELLLQYTERMFLSLNCNFNSYILCCIFIVKNI